MSYRQYCLLALAAVAPALAQPSVDQILETYRQALGGQTAYEKVTTRAMKGTVEIPDDNVTGAAQVVAKAPGSFRLKMDIPHELPAILFTGAGGRGARACPAQRRSDPGDVPAGSRRTNRLREGYHARHEGHGNL